MAIAVDSQGGEIHIASTSHTQSFTVGTGSNRKLIVAVETQAVGDVVTGITYNGVSMTQAVKRVSHFSSAFFEYMYYLDAPASGANNIVVSCSSSVAIGLAYASYTGCATGTDSTVNSSAASGTTFAQAFTTVADNSWTIDWIRADAGGAIPTASTNSFKRTGVTGDVGIILCDSNSAITPAGSYTMNYTSAVSTTWTSVGMSFAPSVSQRSNFFAFM